MVKELDQAHEALLATGDPRDQGFAEMIAGMIKARGGDIGDAIPETLLERSLLDLENEPTQVANAIEKIGPDTLMFIGSLALGIFTKLAEHNIREVYTSYPEGKIIFEDLAIGGKNKKDLEKEMGKKGIKIGSYAASMMKSSDFTTQNDTQTLTLVRLHVRDLGIDKAYPTTTNIYSRAKELGLDLCPAEVGPHQRLKDTDQPMGDVYFIGMKQIADSDGNPSVFRLARNDDGLWLYGSWARPDSEWNPENVFVFGLRK